MFWYIVVVVLLSIATFAVGYLLGMNKRKVSYVNDGYRKRIE